MSRFEKINVPYSTGAGKIKLLSNNVNDTVVILLPGQSMPPEMFFDCRMFADGSRVSDRFLEAGIDSAFFDPVGFGEATGAITDLYTRETLAAQIGLVIELLRPRYKKLILHGYCSSAPGAIFAAMGNDLIDGLFLQSPPLMEAGPEFAVQYLAKRDPINRPLLLNNLDNMLQNRLIPYTDSGRGYSTRPDNWKHLMTEKLVELFPSFEPGHWGATYDMTVNNRLYYSLNRTHGWDISKIKCKISVLLGEFDVECDTQNYAKLKEMLLPRLTKEIRVKNSSHFGFWETNIADWANGCIEAMQCLIKQDL